MPDMPDYGDHRCLNKIRVINVRTHVQLNHNEVSYLCEDLWKCTNAEEFYKMMNGMSDEELEKWAKRAKLEAAARKRVRQSAQTEYLYA